MADNVDADSGVLPGVTSGNRAKTETIISDGTNGVSVTNNRLDVNTHFAVDPTYKDHNTAIPLQSQLIGGNSGVNIVPVLVDSQGRIINSPLSGLGTGFSFGKVDASLTARVVVNSTVYTEQTTNAQRSIVSSSALDTALGTGARTVRITYFTATGTGPFTEDLTLNGILSVNTVATNICFIENMMVLTGGASGTNAGVITLKAAVAGAGATIGTIGASENQTLWCHHYVSSGKTCKITGIAVAHNGSTVGSGALFTVNVKPMATTDAIEIQTSGFFRLFGQSGTISRVFQSPINVVGPARIRVFVTPESATAINYRAAIDFFEL